jgi:transposase
MTSEKLDTRRRYSAALKAQVVASCDEPGASVAKVAMAHGINANVVHRWRRLAREGKATPAKAGEFIALPLMVAPETAPTCADIRVELRRGAFTMTITWPSSAAADFAVWARELLR